MVLLKIGRKILFSRQAKWYSKNYRSLKRLSLRKTKVSTHRENCDECLNVRMCESYIFLKEQYLDLCIYASQQVQQA